MKDTGTQFVHLLQRTERRIRLPVAVLAVGLGVVLMAHAVSLGWYRPGMLAGVPLGHLLPGFQFLLGAVLATLGLVGQNGHGTPSRGALLAVGTLVLVTGPASPLALGLVLWTVVGGVTLVCVGLPALVLTAVGVRLVDVPVDRRASL